MWIGSMFISCYDSMNNNNKTKRTVLTTKFSRFPLSRIGRKNSALLGREYFLYFLYEITDKIISIIIRHFQWRMRGGGRIGEPPPNPPPIWAEKIRSYTISNKTIRVSRLKICIFAYEVFFNFRATPLGIFTRSWESDKFLVNNRYIQYILY